MFVDVMREPGAIYSPDNPAYAELHAPYVPKELTRAMERGLAGFSPSPVRVASPGESPTGETSTMRADKVGSTKATFEHRGVAVGGDASEPSPATGSHRVVSRSHAVVVHGEGSGRAALRARSRAIRPDRVARRGSRRRWRRRRSAPRMTAREVLAAKKKGRHRRQRSMFEESSAERQVTRDKMEDVMSELLAAYAGGDEGTGSPEGGGGEAAAAAANVRGVLGSGAGAHPLHGDRRRDGQGRRTKGKER